MMNNLFNPIQIHLEIKKIWKSISKDLEPYRGDNLEGMILDIDYGLDHLLDKIKIKKTGQDDCKLLIRAEPRDLGMSLEEIGKEIIKCWKEDISFDHEYHKLELMDNQLEFDFITWQSMYITGRIVIKKNAR